MTEEHAEDVISDFIKAGDDWLQGMINLEKITGKNYCTLCGTKPSSIKLLIKALKLIIK